MICLFPRRSSLLHEIIFLQFVLVVHGVQPALCDMDDF